MRKVSIFGLLVIFSSPLWAEIELDTVEKRLNYTVGMQIGQQLQMENIPVDREALFQGLNDFLDRKPPQLSFPEQQKAVADYHESQNQELQALRKRNLLQGQAYLKANSTKRGVQVTHSGLQYKILKEGKGPKPVSGSTVKVHYEGRLVDGSIFDSSYERDTPITINLQQVIPGWREALPMIPVGSKWQLVIPSELAYGDSGSASMIPPNAVLIYDLELLEIVDTTAAEKSKSSAH